MAIVEGVKYWADNEPVRGFDANAYLMSQSVMRFDNASDRDSALARSLTSGMIAYNKSTTTLQLYDGTSWIDVATGTITVSPGGSDGQVQYNNGGTFSGASGLTYDDIMNQVGMTHVNISRSGTALSQPAIDIENSGGSGDYNYFLRADNDTGPKAVFFVNGSTRSADGGINTMTLRNDGGPSRFGNANFTTYLTGGTIELHDGTQARLVVNSSGNVGIGDTTPSYKLDVNGDGRFVNNLYITGTSTMLEVEHSSDSGLAEIRAQGSSQGTGAVFAGQSNSYGGGIFYNGDGTPAYATGESADRISFFRRSGGSNEVVFSYPYNSNTVDFRGGVYIAGTTSLGSGSPLRIAGGSGGSYGVHKIYADYKYRMAIVPESYTSYGISMGEYYSRPTVCSWTTSQPLYLVGGGNVQIGIHTNNRVCYFDTAGVYLEQGWFRTFNATGWYSQSYNGGWYMQDTSWVRSYSAKHVYTNGGQLRAYKYSGSTGWDSVSLQGQSSQNSGIGFQSYASNTHTGQWRPASGIWYARNYNDSGYITVAAYISNQSSRRMKQDIESWGVAKPLSSAVNVTYDTTATDLIKQLRPVSYRFKKQDRLVRDMDTERRQSALNRLNAIKVAAGEDQYDGEEAVHLCGRDCNNTPESPCFMYQNWERGTIGFIAEEVGEVIPEATDMNLKPDSPYQGENGAIDGLALTAVLTKALQEVEARLAALEATLS